MVQGRTRALNFTCVYLLLCCLPCSDEWYSDGMRSIENHWWRKHLTTNSQLPRRIQGLRSRYCHGHLQRFENVHYPRSDWHYLIVKFLSLTMSIRPCRLQLQRIQPRNNTRTYFCTCNNCSSDISSCTHDLCGRWHCRSLRTMWRTRVWYIQRTWLQIKLTCMFKIVTQDPQNASLLTNAQSPTTMYVFSLFFSQNITWRFGLFTVQSMSIIRHDLCLRLQNLTTSGNTMLNNHTTVIAVSAIPSHHSTLQRSFFLWIYATEYISEQEIKSQKPHICALRRKTEALKAIRSSKGYGPMHDTRPIQLSESHQKCEKQDGQLKGSKLLPTNGHRDYENILTVSRPPRPWRWTCPGVFDFEITAHKLSPGRGKLLSVLRGLGQQSTLLWMMV